MYRNRSSGEDHYTNEKQPSKKKFSELKATNYAKVNDQETLPLKTQQQTKPMSRLDPIEAEV